jgi:hypothetical protein
MKHHLQVVYKITDEETGVVYSASQASDITGVKLTTVYTWYNIHQCNTIQKITERSKTANVTGNPPKVYRTCRGDFSADEISNMIKQETGSSVHRGTVIQRINNYGADSPAVWFPKCTRRQFTALREKAGIPESNVGWNGYKTSPKAPKFDRASICWRNKFQYGCKKYSDMLWDLVDGKFPECYKDDGSCFDGIDVSKM